MDDTLWERYGAPVVAAQSRSFVPGRRVPAKKYADDQRRRSDWGPNTYRGADGLVYEKVCDPLRVRTMMSNEVCVCRCAGQENTRFWSEKCFEKMEDDGDVD